MRAAGPAFGGATMPVSYFSAQKYLKFFGGARPDASKITVSEVRTWKDCQYGVEPGYYLIESASGDRTIS